MNIQRIWNTKKAGVIEFLFYKEKDKYIGVCLTFDIIEEEENPSILKKSLMEASMLHLEAVVKKNLPDELLNRYAPTEYWDKYFAFQNLIARKKVENKIQKNAPSILTFPYPSFNESAMAC